MGNKKETPDVNASSTADIAFLLLVFFLVSTTMTSDLGLSRMLPPMAPKDQTDAPIIKERNVFMVQLNYNNQLLVNGEWKENANDLKNKAKEFIANPMNDPTLSEKSETDVPGIGKVMVSKGVISLQNDRGSTYQKYLEIQNELQAAYTELRDEFAKKQFKKSFEDCSDDEKDAIKKVYPQKISEAEPKNYKK